MPTTKQEAQIELVRAVQYYRWACKDLGRDSEDSRNAYTALLDAIKDLEDLDPELKDPFA
jgi:hypothetical protein